MSNYLKATEVPQTKLQLKKAILNGSIAIFENDNSYDSTYRKVGDLPLLFKLWEGFRYKPKYQGENEATAYLGTSFCYKFKKA